MAGWVRAPAARGSLVAILRPVCGVAAATHARLAIATALDGASRPLSRAGVGAPTRTFCRELTSRTTAPEFSVGDLVDGRVAEKWKDVGIMLDIGGGRRARLDAPHRLSKKLDVDERLPGLRVVGVDREKGHVTVACDGLKGHIARRFRPLSDFSVGDVVSGRVAHKMRGVGVFLDIGAVVDALLSAPRGMAMKLKPSEVLEGLRVESLDREKEQLAVTCDDLEARVRRRYRPISDFSVGDGVDGHVAFKKKDCVFIDVGAQRNALLSAPSRMAMQLESDERLEGLRIKEVDLERGHLSVSFDKLAEHVKKSAKKKQRRPISDFSVGDVVDGRVASKVERLGVFLDIGAVRDARLDAPREMAMKLEPNMLLQGLHVEDVDQEKERLVVVCHDLEALVRDRPTPTE